MQSKKHKGIDLRPDKHKHTADQPQGESQTNAKRQKHARAEEWPLPKGRAKVQLVERKVNLLTR